MWLGIMPYLVVGGWGWVAAVRTESAQRTRLVVKELETHTKNWISLSGQFGISEDWLWGESISWESPKGNVVCMYTCWGTWVVGS